MSLRNLKKCRTLVELPEISMDFHTRTHLPKPLAAVTDSVISKKLLQDESSYPGDAMIRYRFFYDVCMKNDIVENFQLIQLGNIAF